MKNAESALAPGVLVAIPLLRDPNFVRAVVLMVEHGGDGAMGLIINKPLRLSDLREWRRYDPFLWSI